MSWDLTVEHRLTVLEAHMEAQRDINTKTEKRITYLNHGLTGLVFAIGALVQEKVPDWAKIAAALFKAAMQP